MQNTIPIETLQQAAKTELLTFEFIPNTPINIRNTSTIDHLTIGRIIERYLQNGFAIVELESENSSPEALLSLGESLELGEPFIPPLYLNGGYTAKTPISKISTDTKDGTHPIFEHEVEVKFHSDGTLQQIGYVKTTIMLCKSPSAEGGDTILFNASAAFAELIINDMAAAVALTSSGTFIRQANINGCRDINRGSAFSIQNGEVICAYSVTATDSFIAANGVNKGDLERGLNFIKYASEPGSPYFVQFQLGAKQAIILANSKISHGRTSYRNTDNYQRCLYRGLYLEHPKLKVFSNKKILKQKEAQLS